MEGGASAVDFVPFGFAPVTQGVFRSSYPYHRMLAYVQRLGLRSMVCLSPGDLKSDLRDFCRRHEITLVEVDVGLNQEPFLSMSFARVQQALEYALDPAHQPCLLFCTNGKNRTATVVGVFRRLQRWALSSIFQEYELFTAESASGLDTQFIELFPVVNLAQKLVHKAASASASASAVDDDDDVIPTQSAGSA